MVVRVVQAEDVTELVDGDSSEVVGAASKPVVDAPGEVAVENDIGIQQSVTVVPRLRHRKGAGAEPFASRIPPQDITTGVGPAAAQAAAGVLPPGKLEAGAGAIPRTQPIDRPTSPGGSEVGEAHVDRNITCVPVRAQSGPGMADDLREEQNQSRARHGHVRLAR